MSPTPSQAPSSFGTTQINVPTATTPSGVTHSCSTPPVPRHHPHHSFNPAPSFSVAICMLSAIAGTTVFALKRSLVSFDIFIPLSYFLFDDNLYFLLSDLLNYFYSLPLNSAQRHALSSRYPCSYLVISYIGMFLCTLITMHDLKFLYFPTLGKLVKYKQRKSSTYLCQVEQRWR